MITIIDYEKHHQPYFDSLNRIWIEKYFEIEPFDDYVLTNPEEAVLQKGGAIFIAMYENIVAGVVALIKIDDDTYEFTKMGVHGDYRRKGIAEALSYAAFKRVKDLKGKKVILFSNTILEGAILLYKKLGFIEVPLNDATEYRRANIKMELLLKANE